MMGLPQHVTFLLLLWSQSEIFTFRPVCDEFQDLWVIGVSYWSSLCDQHDPLTPQTIGGMMCGRDFPLTMQPSTSIWGARSSFASCQSLPREPEPLHNLPGSLFQLGCNGTQILCVPKFRISGAILDFLWILFARDSRKVDSHWLQCTAYFSHLVLTLLVQGPLYEQSPFSGLLLKSFFF